MSNSVSPSSELTIESKASELRKTGISVIGDVRWGTHFCYFYETKQDLLDTLVLYFKAGLESQEFCVWVTSPVLSVEEVKDALGQAVPDLHRHLAEGDLEIHSHQEWYLRDGRWDSQRVLQSWREKLNQGSGNGYAGFRAAGDGGWIQSDHWMAFCEYEKQVNAMIADQRSVILCTYPLTTSSGDQVFDVAHIHHMALARRHGSWEMVETPQLRQAKAEIKRLNDELEQRVEERTRELATANEALRSEIAERKLAEESVKQAEDRIRVIIDTIPTMVWSLRPDGVVDFVNQRWVDYTGVSFQDALREPNGIIHPEDLPRVVQNWLGDMAAGRPSEEEMRLRRRDGEYRWFLIRTVPLRDKEGDIVKWYGTSSDIEDRKQAEMQSRRLIDAIPHQIWSGPADGTLDYCNERWRAYMGLDQEALCGDGWQSMLHPDDRDRVLEAWRASVVSGTPYEQEERHLGADGTYRWFLARGLPQRDAEGRVVRWYGTNTDIEERKQAEEALHAQALRYKTLTETSTDSIYVLDAEGNLQEANAAFLRRRGYAAADVKDLNVADWDAQWSREQLLKRVRMLLGSSAVFETRHRCKDGSIFDVEVSGTSVRIAEEQLIFCMARDITERKRAAQALRESEERFRELAENINEVFWVWTAIPGNAHLLYVSPAYETIWGRSCDSLYSSPRSWMEALHPQDKERILEEGARMDFEKVSDWTYRIVRPDQSIRWIRDRIFPVRDVRGAVVRFAGIAEDITERKQAEQALRESEERLQSFFAGATAGLCILDRKLRYVRINETLAEMNGAPVAEHLGRSIQEVLPGIAPVLGPLIEQVFVTGKPILDIELSGETPREPGVKRHWIESMFPIVAIHDQTEAVGIIAVEITASKRAKEALDVANRQLQVLSRRRIQEQEDERRRLSRELHDQIGQSLTAAKINVEVLRTWENPACLGRIDETIAILDQLLGQVRQISLDLRPPMLDDLGLVPALRSFLDEQGRRASITVHFSAEYIPEKLDPEIQITCFRIAQEAITNAVRHAKATRIDIALRCTHGEELRLLARDDGIGFDARARQAQAVDLGLIGIKERAALVGGRAKIISSPGKGTTVDVSLPLKFRGERQACHM